MHSKETLAEFIYELDKVNNFLRQRLLWSSPIVGFSHNNSLPGKFIKQLRKSDILQDETVDDVICILADWECVAEGIIFTDKAIYVNSPKNTDKRFYITYDNILNLDYDYDSDEPKLTIDTWSVDGTYIVDNVMWSKRNIYDFLQFACEIYDFNDKNKDEIVKIRLKRTSGASVGSIAAGITYGNVSNASSIYFDDKIVTPRGHGFAAENANHLADLYSGKKAQIVGNDNAPNGADRIVDGIAIQSKYCASGAKCVHECFDKNGQFRYWNAADKTAMQIEVPSDMYEAAVQALEERIKHGGLHGKIKINGKEYKCSVTDPAEAKNIIRKGHFTYAQAKNIAKAGTVESICYDAASGAIIATKALGISATVSFAVALWNGEDFEDALKVAAAQGLKVGGTTFISAVIAGQLSKAGLNSALVASSEAIVRMMGPKASALLANALRSGTNIFGAPATKIYGAAAMKSAAKTLRGNVITAAASFVVLSAGDVANIFQGRISGGQLFKNLANTAAGIGGGMAGWAGGATVGATVGSVIPLVGTAAGAFVGGLIGAFGGGSAASSLSGAVLDEFIEDDANKMVTIIQEVFTELASEYLVTQEEAEHIADSLKERLTGATLKDMFASDDRRQFARALLEVYFEEVSFNREYISLPTDDEMQRGLKAVLEDIADEVA